MASSVLEFITGRKQKIRAAEMSAWQLYRQLVENFADGVEVDCDEADLILDQAGRSEADLQRDVDVLTERRRLASTLAASQDAEQTMRKELATIETLVAQLRDVEAKTHPKIQAARERYNAAERTAHQRSTAIAKLAETVMEPDLIVREKAVSAELHELVPPMREIDEQIKSLRLPYYESQVANLRGKNSGFPWTKEKNHEDLDRYQSELTNRTAQRDRLNDERAKLESRMAELRREQEQIAKAKLIP